MPLKGKKPFKRLEPPEDLNPNEELFYLKATHEVFRNYDDFFERVIMCNSLVWSCSLTGKSNLTFPEALSSEEAARESLRTFPLSLKKPILYLASLAQGKRQNDMCEDIFLFIKDRFFVGDEVEVTVNGVKKSSEVTQVILPERAVKSPTKASENKQKKPRDIQPSKIKYEVVNYGTGRTTVVKPDCMSRPKGAYNKSRNKLFIKHHTEVNNGVCKVKEHAMAKEQMEDFQFSEVFCGPLPKFAIPEVVKKPSSVEKKEKTPNKRALNESTGKRTVQGKLNFKKETAEEKKKNLEKQTVTGKTKLEMEKERLRLEDMKKQKIEDAKERNKQRRQIERLKLKEEKERMDEYLKGWKKPRDDLECDDLKELPAAVPIDCGVSPDCFGDALMILEFLNTFEKQVHVKDVFPHGVTFGHIERALTEVDTEGALNDLLQLLLGALFRYQEAEDDSVNIKNREMHELGHMNLKQASDVATIIHTWPVRYHGTILRNIALDSFSLTEILRLHIMSSGYKNHINWMGFATLSEDPGLYFKIDEPELLKKLAKTSVFDLNSDERCKILVLLINQLLSSDVLHYAVDDNADNSRPLRHQLRLLRMAHSRRNKEAALSSTKKRVSKVAKTEENTEVPTDEAAVDEEEKDNTDNLTPEQLAELNEKKAKDAARQKSEFLRKEREMGAQLRKLNYSFNATPLGRDRAYRRYWVFQTVAGIFVEDDDPMKGHCLPKQTVQTTNQNLLSPEKAANNIKKYLQSIGATSGSSDKENDILRDIAIVQSDLPFPLKDRKLSDLNPRVDTKKGFLENGLTEKDCLLCKSKKTELPDSDTLVCPHSKVAVSMDQCTANMDTCPVHNLSTPRTKWSFYYKEEDVDNLIASLNPRGFREASLKKALLSEKERLKEEIVKCPSHTFNKTLPPPLQPEVRKSQRRQGPNYSDGSLQPPRLVLELTLRDMILELEHRMFHGGLGNLKHVEDRDSWRAALEHGAVELQVDGPVKQEGESEDSKEKVFSNKSEEETVKELSVALHQISTGIEWKYLNPPLKEIEKPRPKTSEVKKPPEDEENDKDWKLYQSKIKRKQPKTLQLWRETLLECTSLSQLFVYLGTLEKSVAWSRSVLKAHCRICRKRGDAENMLLCDGCNRGHHLYCLKPPLKTIPEGDWFCLNCKPIETPRPQKKINYVEKSSDDEEQSDEADEEQSEEESEVDVEDEDSNATADNAGGAQEWCEKCGDVGELLCCDRCPLMYHAECVNLRRIPRGEWLCPKCSKKSDAARKAQKHPHSGSYGTRSATITSTDKKKTTKEKLVAKGSKRKYEDSYEEEYSEKPAKRACRERRSNANDTDKEDNPFKKVYRDSAQGTARRRSKTGNDSDTLDYKSCIDMLVELMKHPSSWPFLVPVSKKDAPGYHQIIKRPMDFGTIRSKLNYMSYKTNEDFVHDVYLVLQNCEWFNPSNSPEYKAAQVLHKEVKKLLQDYNICDLSILNNFIQNVNDES